MQHSAVKHEEDVNRRISSSPDGRMNLTGDFHVTSKMNNLMQLRPTIASRSGGNYNSGKFFRPATACGSGRKQRCAHARFASTTAESWAKGKTCKRNDQDSGLQHGVPYTASDGNNSLLDLGCGTGHFIPYAYEKGYSNYLGVDISPDMVALARLTYPTADIVVASAANFTETVPISQRKFDAIVSILMICALPSIRDIMDVFKESHKVLKDTGKLLVCVPHPAFDPYMQCGLYGENWCRLGGAPVRTEYSGYYANGRVYDITRNVGPNETPLTFRDYHYNLGALIGCLAESGFLLAALDECQPTVSDMAGPSHVVLVARKA